MVVTKVAADTEIKEIVGKYLLILVGGSWLVFTLVHLEVLNSQEVLRLGIYPRSLKGLVGLITSPFLHGSFSHLFSNSVAICALSLLGLTRYPKVIGPVMLFSWFGSGVGIWIMGRASYHIGASGIVYGLAFFILILGFLRKDRRNVALSLLICFLYGGIFFGILPGDPKVSWEGHLWGGVVGVCLAFYYRSQFPVLTPLWKKQMDSNLLKDHENALNQLQETLPTSNLSNLASYEREDLDTYIPIKTKYIENWQKFRLVRWVYSLFVILVIISGLFASYPHVWSGLMSRESWLETFWMFAISFFILFLIIHFWRCPRCKHTFRVSIYFVSLDNRCFHCGLPQFSTNDSDLVQNSQDQTLN